MSTSRRILLTILALDAAALLGCDGSSKASAPTATPTATAAPAPASASARAVASASASPLDPKALVATCTDKEAGSCKEYLGELPALAEDLCKGLDGKGVLTKGAAPCPRNDVLGTCVIDRGTSSEVDLSYAQPGVSANDAHTSCELKAGVWTVGSAVPGRG